jgi:hypothetical protein
VIDKGLMRHFVWLLFLHLNARNAKIVGWREYKVGDVTTNACMIINT